MPVARRLLTCHTNGKIVTKLCSNKPDKIHSIQEILLLNEPIIRRIYTRAREEREREKEREVHVTASLKLNRHILT